MRFFLFSFFLKCECALSSQISEITFFHPEHAQGGTTRKAGVGLHLDDETGCIESVLFEKVVMFFTKGLRLTEPDQLIDVSKKDQKVTHGHRHSS